MYESQIVEIEEMNFDHYIHHFDEYDEHYPTYDKIFENNIEYYEEDEELDG